MKNKGVTIVELIVVMAIIAILIFIDVPTFTCKVRNKFYIKTQKKL